MNRRTLCSLALAVLLAPALVPAAFAAEKFMDLSGPWIFSLDARGRDQQHGRDGKV